MPGAPPIAVGLDYRPALLGRSGIPRAVRELARALAAEPSVALHLFAHCWARPRPEARPPAGARLHRTRLPGRALPWLARAGLDAARLSGGVRVFHWTDFVFPPVGRRPAVALTVHDCAFVVDPAWHGADAARLAERTRAAAARADLVICPSRATAADVAARLGVPAARIRVVPFGADHGPPPSAESPLGAEPYVLMLGTVEPRKNHQRALAAWRALGPDRPRLLVVGRAGWAGPEVLAALRAAAAREPLTWLTEADDQLVADLTAHGRALLYPSLFEGFGFPVLEALRWGVPVVCGDHEALREVGGPAATYCDPTSVESIADALRRALDGGDDRSARAARQAQAARFRWSDCASAHAALYREIAP